MWGEIVTVTFRDGRVFQGIATHIEEIPERVEWTQFGERRVENRGSLIKIEAREFHEVDDLRTLKGVRRKKQAPEPVPAPEAEDPNWGMF